MSVFSLIWVTKLFSHLLKILNYDGLWENKKLAHENQRFDWIKLIHWYRLVNIGWLADTELFDSMIWGDMVNKSSSFGDFVRFRSYTYARTQNLRRPYGRQLTKSFIKTPAIVKLNGWNHLVFKPLYFFEKERLLIK